MIDPLYQKAILRLAAAATGAGRLDPHDGTAMVRNPLCGDQITVDLTFAGDRIASIGHSTRACVLCQASAALMSETLTGLPGREAGLAHGRVRDYLATTVPAALSPELSRYEVFAPVIAHPERHTCVLLPLDALRNALAGAAMTGKPDED